MFRLHTRAHQSVASPHASKKVYYVMARSLPFRDVLYGAPFVYNLIPPLHSVPVLHSPHSTPSLRYVVRYAPRSLPPFGWFMISGAPLSFPPSRAVSFLSSLRSRLLLISILEHHILRSER